VYVQALETFEAVGQCFGVLAALVRQAGWRSRISATKLWMPRLTQKFSRTLYADTKSGMVISCVKTRNKKL
jgi:hypothetical protein